MKRYEGEMLDALGMHVGAGVALLMRDGFVDREGWAGVQMRG